MLFKLALLELLSGSAALAAQLYAAHYSGTLHLLTFTQSYGGNYSLVDTKSIVGGGKMPAWMTLDYPNRQLYVSDEDWNTPVALLSAFSLNWRNELTPIGIANSTSAVHNTLYGPGYIAQAHYGGSSFTTYKLPLSPSTQVLQKFSYTMPGPGPNPARQEAPHPHGVHTDPSGKFLFVPDLGMDRIHMFKINKSTGQLTACPDIIAPPGSGPRHAAFWPPNDARMLYSVYELTSAMGAYTLKYNGDDCPSVNLVQVLNAYAGNATAPKGTKGAEVIVKDNYVYLPNRNDLKFNPNDSITQYTINPSTGLLTYTNNTNAYGWYPRTFVINKAGDFAAIGDQTSANIAIVKRDVRTGTLGKLVASLRIGDTGQPESETGISSVIWIE
jgi:6-phosphogluconolactonase (cycloisomerase 2 family)